MAKGTSTSASKRARSNPNRVALMRLGVRALLLLVAVSLMIVAWVTARRVFYAENPRTLLRNVRVVLNNDRMNPDDIRKHLTVEPGKDNLMGIDLEAVRKRLLSEPLLEQAEVRRQLPGTLEIQAYLRVPVAHLVTTDGLLIDRHGQIIPPLTIRGADRLPVILGVRNVVDFRAGDVITDDAMLLGALQILRVQATHAQGNWLNIDTIQLDYWHRWIYIHLNENRKCGIRPDAKITIGLEDIPAALNRAFEVLAVRAGAGQPTSVIEALSEKVVVRP